MEVVSRPEIPRAVRDIWESILNTHYLKILQGPLAGLLKVLRPGLILTFVVVMLAWSGHSLARLFWLLIPQTPVAEIGSDITVPVHLSSTRKPVTDVDLGSLQQTFRFGDADGTPTTTAMGSEPASSTRLPLVLRGAVASSGSVGASAIIASGDNQQVYFPGDALQGTAPGVSLSSVHEAYVVIDNNGRLETLWMYEPTPTAAGGQAPATSLSAANPSEVSPSGLYQSEVRPTEVGNSPVDNLGDRLRVGLYRESGKVAGFQIREGSDTRILQAAGLRVGDVITAIDGVALTGMEGLPALGEQLRQQETVRVDVTRDGNSVSVALRRDALPF